MRVCGQGEGVQKPNKFTDVIYGWFPAPLIPSNQLSYGEHHAHNTALHYASRHGMKHLIRAFLNDLDGDPNRRDACAAEVSH